MENTASTCRPLNLYYIKTFETIPCLYLSVEFRYVLADLVTPFSVQLFLEGTDFPILVLRFQHLYIRTMFTFLYITILCYCLS